MSGSDRQSEVERTIEDCWGCGKMDCGRTGWTVDPHSSTLSSQRKQTGRLRGYLDGNPRILAWEPQQHVILCGDFNVNLFGMTDYFHVGESIPRPRTLIDTNDSLRARALHTMVTELDLTVTNTWMNADTERELFTRSSWSNPEDSLTQMDFIMTSRKLEMKHVQFWIQIGSRQITGRCMLFFR